MLGKYDKEISGAFKGVGSDGLQTFGQAKRDVLRIAERLFFNRLERGRKPFFERIPVYVRVPPKQRAFLGRSRNPP